MDECHRLIADFCIALVGVSQWATVLVVVAFGDGHAHRLGGGVAGVGRSAYFNHCDWHEFGRNVGGFSFALARAFVVCHRKTGLASANCHASCVAHFRHQFVDYSGGLCVFMVHAFACVAPNGGVFRLCIVRCIWRNGVVAATFVYTLSGKIGAVYKRGGGAESGSTLFATG